MNNCMSEMNYVIKQLSLNFWFETLQLQNDYLIEKTMLERKISFPLLKGFSVQIFWVIEVKNNLGKHENY